MNVRELEKYKDIGSIEIDQLLEEEITRSNVKFIVLDDDPTGVQTVHDISVFTDWDEGSIREGINENNNLFYILTNSRGLTAKETEILHRQIAKTVKKVSKEVGKECIIISRSDSTLRGHYPLETNIIREELEEEGNKIDGEIICPFFLEGGRYTVNNIHYVKYGNELIPAAETEFAADVTFGYRNSDLTKYIEEKTKGKYKSEDVITISLEELRDIDLKKIESKLLNVKNFNKICVNAISYLDLKVFAVALYRAMEKEKKYLFRTAAGLVKVLGNISDRPLLEYKDLIKKDTNRGGIIVVGSHMKKSTAQLKALLDLEDVIPIEFNSNLVMKSDEEFWSEVERCVSLAEQYIEQGKTVVCYTNRTLLKLENDTPEKALKRSIKISDGVQSLVGKLSIEPAFVIAKGGITSADIGKKALRVKKALVLGQIKPGIPVWQTDKVSKFPEIPYVIFPGNVGSDNTLREVVQMLLNKGSE